MRVKLLLFAVLAAALSAKEVLENNLKNAIHDKNLRKCFKKYNSSVKEVANSQAET